MLRLGNALALGIALSLAYYPVAGWSNEITKQDAGLIYNTVRKWDSLRTDIVNVMLGVQTSGGDITCIQSVHEEVHSIALSMSLLQFLTTIDANMLHPDDEYVALIMTKRALTILSDLFTKERIVLNSFSGACRRDTLTVIKAQTAIDLLAETENLFQRLQAHIKVRE